MTKFTKADAKRRGELIHALARLSRNGWRGARPCDYLPLEAELRGLDAKARATKAAP